MEKFFNTAGPCNNEEHYMLFDKEITNEIMFLIKRKQYFVIHAARQTGKTTLLQQLAEQIEIDNKYYVLYCSLESVQVFVEPKEGIIQILNSIKKALKYSDIPKKESFANDVDLSATSTLIIISKTLFFRNIRIF